MRIGPNITISDDELELSFVRSSGPGGQNVNKVATACQLRFDVRNTDALPEAVKERLAKLAGSKMTDAGELIIDARRSRSQSRNREDALERLKELVRQAAKKPKRRRKTRPTAASRRRRLRKKRHRSEIKELRKPPRRE